MKILVDGTEPRREERLKRNRERFNRKYANDPEFLKEKYRKERLRKFHKRHENEEWYIRCKLFHSEPEPKIEVTAEQIKVAKRIISELMSQKGNNELVDRLRKMIRSPLASTSKSN